MLMTPRFIILIMLLIMLLALTGERALSQEAVTPSGRPAVASLRVGVFPEEVSRAYTTKENLPSNDVRSIAITASGDVYAATARGLARFSAGTWTTVAAEGAGGEEVAVNGYEVWFISAGKLVQLHGAAFLLPPWKVNQITVGKNLSLATDAGLYILDGTNFVLDTGLDRLLGSEKAVRQLAIAVDGRIAVAAMAGLFLKPAGGDWSAVYPRNATRSWATHDVRGVAFDSQDRLWFSSAQGAGCEDKEWHLYTGADGLPYNDFTTLHAGKMAPFGSVHGWAQSATTARIGNIARGGAGYPTMRCGPSL